MPAVATVGSLAQAETPEDAPDRTYARAMALKRVTIRVPEEVLAKARRAVDEGRAASVSAYFVRLAAREPDWVAAQKVIDELIAEMGGIDPETEAWVDSVLGDDEDDAVKGRG